jgi:hypothetical protein
MGISAQILVYTAWLVVAIAVVGAIYLSLARRDLLRDRAVLSGYGAKVARRVSAHVSPRLRLIRARSQPMTPAARAGFQSHKSAGVRVALFLMVPLLILGYRWAGREWGLVAVLCGLIYVPAVTIPFSIAHTYLLRMIGTRGPIVSTATGLVLGLVVGRSLQDFGFMKLAVIYGAVYGLIIGLGNTSLAAPGLIPDDRPRTLEEQARADGL